MPSTPSSVSESSGSDQFADAPEYFDQPETPAKYELHIPAPQTLSREESFQHHITTRNFFAWMFNKPLVGSRLGDALIALFDRMNDFRPYREQNEDDLLVYLDCQGYTDFRDCRDHALAVLRFAEQLQLRELWTDAFAHCAGMWEQLDMSAEFELISRTSQALVSRAHLEMDLRLERAGSSLSNFLEDDLSGTYIGLGKEAHLHMERFRSFLHTFYINKHGYWPPTSAPSISSLPKSVYRSMYFEFRNLYDYLVDLSSGTSIQDNKPVDGGICVYQNVQAFDQRHKYSPLPHPLPLVPKLPAQLSRNKSFSRLFGNRQAKMERRARAADALAAAANLGDREIMACSLVREYMQFEKVWTIREDSTVSSADARKVRWILVYAILQTLISVTRAPQEVRDTEGVAYPLCCQIGGTPPWQTEESTRKIKPTLQPLRTSLREQILELGPDMDIISAKPSPLTVPGKDMKTSFLPRSVSINNGSFIRSPQPIRVSSWEILNQGNPGVSPIDINSNSLFQFGNVSPINHQDVSPISQHSDPTTPSNSEGAGSSGWSPSFSEDDMDHPSVTGSDSNYGDEEDEGGLSVAKKSVKPAIPPRKRPSAGSFRPGSGNPEVEAYLQS
ncbi:hypothetical protein ACLMJK_006943 [Lecanora helva]